MSKIAENRNNFHCSIHFVRKKLCENVNYSVALLLNSYFDTKTHLFRFSTSKPAKRGERPAFFPVYVDSYDNISSQCQTDTLNHLLEVSKEVERWPKQILEGYNRTIDQWKQGPSWLKWKWHSILRPSQKSRQCGYLMMVIRKFVI